MARSTELFAADGGLPDAVFEPTAHGRNSRAQSRQRLVPSGARLIRRAQEQGRVQALENTDRSMLQLMLSWLHRGFRRGCVAADLEPLLTVILDGLRSDRRRPTPLPVAAPDAEELKMAFGQGGAVLGR